ncbi:unnamed protein product [Mytilus coruscus]|uniref:Uncharacterized protein n=1 Tax=Mytilus coruscus TaxID=42192 RepID=A0A6J8BCG5_MYTCO|nr:unnamed protein product [Mytilus coruscus]
MYKKWNSRYDNTYAKEAAFGSTVIDQPSSTWTVQPHKEPRRRRRPRPNCELHELKARIHIELNKDTEKFQKAAKDNFYASKDLTISFVKRDYYLTKMADAMLNKEKGEKTPKSSFEDDLLRLDEDEIAYEGKGKGPAKRKCSKTSFSKSSTGSGPKVNNKDAKGKTL